MIQIDANSSFLSIRNNERIGYAWNAAQNRVNVKLNIIISMHMHSLCIHNNENLIACL